MPSNKHRKLIKHVRTSKGKIRGKSASSPSKVRRGKGQNCEQQSSGEKSGASSLISAELDIICASLEQNSP